jgi:hypothetical protein
MGLFVRRDMYERWFPELTVMEDSSSFRDGERRQIAYQGTVERAQTLGLSRKKASPHDVDTPEDLQPQERACGESGSSPTHSGFLDGL